MSKNITIQEGGVAKQLTVDKLKTNLVNSGTCLWVPEDEVQLGTKTITENGTYNASSDGLAGYSQVTVNVAGGSGGGPGGPGSSIVGTDEDGDESVVSVDEDGNIESDKLPSSIKVITPPTNPYGIYQDGQTITKDGMVVKAYLKTGGEYGTVPNGEVTLDPTTAVYDPTTDTGGGESADIDDPAYAGYHPPISAYHELVSTDDHKANPKILFRQIAISSAFLVSYYIEGAGQIKPVFLWISTNQSDTVDVEHHALEDGKEERVSHSTIPLQYSSTTKKSGTTFYYGYGGNLGWSTEEFSIPANIFGPGVSSANVHRDVATILIDGTTTPIQAGSRQQITASWPQPRTGKALTDTFEILVAPGYTPGGGE